MRQSIRLTLASFRTFARSAANSISPGRAYLLAWEVVNLGAIHHDPAPAVEADRVTGLGGGPGLRGRRTRRPPAMNDVTRILEQIEQGDPLAAERLWPLVYDELKQLAAAKMRSERADHTLQATALVHEAYLRLVGASRAKEWESRGHFFSAAAEAMRRILIESARHRKGRDAGGDRRRVAIEHLDIAATTASDPDLLLDIDASLSCLAEEDPEAAELVKLRLFAGLSVTEAGEMLGMSRSAAYRNWEYVTSWFAVHDANPPG